MLQNIETHEGRPFDGIQKTSNKKSPRAEKNQSEKHQGVSYVFEVVDVDVFVLDEFQAFRVWTSVAQVDDVEQMNKNYDQLR